MQSGRPRQLLRLLRLRAQTMANQVASMVLLSTGGDGDPNARVITPAQLLGIFAGEMPLPPGSCLAAAGLRRDWAGHTQR